MSLKDELKDYYTVEELAVLLRVTDAVIEKWQQGGEIIGDAFGAVTRFSRPEVEKLLNKQRRIKMGRAGLAGIGILVALVGGFAARKRRKNKDGA